MCSVGSDRWDLFSDDFLGAGSDRDSTEIDTDLNGSSSLSDRAGSVYFLYKNMHKTSVQKYLATLPAALVVAAIYNATIQELLHSLEMNVTYTVFRIILYGNTFENHFTDLNSVQTII